MRFIVMPRPPTYPFNTELTVSFFVLHGYPSGRLWQLRLQHGKGEGRARGVCFSAFRNRFCIASCSTLVSDYRPFLPLSLARQSPTKQKNISDSAISDMQICEPESTVFVGTRVFRARDRVPHWSHGGKGANGAPNTGGEGNAAMTQPRIAKESGQTWATPLYGPKGAGNWRPLCLAS